MKSQYTIRPVALLGHKLHDDNYPIEQLKEWREEETEKPNQVIMFKAFGRKVI